MNIKKISKASFPFLLKQISQLPEEMDYIGTIPGDKNKFLCVVGSREYTPYGREACEKIIHGLKGFPVVIVSGLAFGIDSIAHEAALAAGLTTISFPGSGLDSSVMYPSKHLNLAQKIVDSGGALISRFESHQEQTYWTFPSRNRLMAGMSHATLIIEARRGSGTLLTAEYATQFDRDVLAIPGSIFSEHTYGPHMLISRGATPIISSEDVLRALGFEVDWKGDDLTIQKSKRSRKLQIDISRDVESGPVMHSNHYYEHTDSSIDRSGHENNFTYAKFDIASMSLEEKRIYDCLNLGALTATDIIEKTKMTSSFFNVFISELEMKGVVKEEGGKYELRK